MKLRHLLYATALLASQAYAASPAPSTRRDHQPTKAASITSDAVFRAASPDCGHKPQTEVLREMLTQVNYMDGDDRAPINKNQNVTHLTDDEVAQISTSGGRIKCPGSDPKPRCNPPQFDGDTYKLDPSVMETNGEEGSTSLVLTDHEAVTNSHIFIDDCGQVRTPLDKCTFQNKAGGKPIPIKASSVKFGVTGVFSETERSDFAFFLLERPVPKAKPIPIDSSPMRGDSTNGSVKGTRIVGVMSEQRDRPDLGKKIAIAVPCNVRQVLHKATDEKPSDYYTDCDAESGASGGAIYGRDINNQLVIKGIFVSTGDNSMDGTRYNPELFSGTRIIGIDSTMIKAAEDLRDSELGNVPQI